MKSPKELVMEIASHPKETCFDLNLCFEFKGKLYEECNIRCDQYRVQFRYREVFSYNDYDYVEDINEIQQLERRVK